MFHPFQSGNIKLKGVLNVFKLVIFSRVGRDASSILKLKIVTVNENLLFFGCFIVNVGPSFLYSFGKRA
jgi:hypothetical protein